MENNDIFIGGIMSYNAGLIVGVIVSASRCVCQVATDGEFMTNVHHGP